MQQQLQVFLAVVDKKNFSRAAEALHMTQPAVSQYIQTLEATIGTRLLERTNKYVRLNKAGEIVYHHAQEILSLYTRMQSLVDDLTHKASGTLSIGASYTFGEYVLPHLIAQMRDHYPLIKPRIVINNTNRIERLVLGNQLDVGIVEGEQKFEKLHIEPFANDVMFVVASAKHWSARQGEVILADLSNETWIVREKGSGTRDAIEKMFKDMSFFPENLIEFGSTQIIKESVEAGLGVTLLSDWAIKKELQLGTLNMLRIKGFPVTRNFSLVTQLAPFQTKALELFIEILRRNFPAEQLS
ncbi:MAG: transcriptional regulator [Desulfitibacter sp. BRH_c19]|nr:MAG: transcriptional regulator [Desulfitibacter sp. BRH_c19]